MKSTLFRAAVVSLLVSTLASIAWSQSQAPADNDPNTRLSKTIGTDIDKIVQHYYIVKNGGVIEFTAKDAADNATISAVQKYFEIQKDLFEKGKNEADADAHGKIPDGIPMLKRLRNEITFFAVKSDDGAALRMFSTNDQARQAIQDFLKFQINAHKTGDPLVADQ